MLRFRKAHVLDARATLTTHRDTAQRQGSNNGNQRDPEHKHVTFCASPRFEPHRLSPHRSALGFCAINLT
jgi:hypothetical protein